MPGGYNNLSLEAQGVLGTLASYGNGRGVLVGVGRLASIISNAGDAATYFQQRTGKKPAIYIWDYCAPEMYPGNETTVTNDTAAAVNLMKAHWEAGGICGFHISWRNFRTASSGYSGDWFDRRRDRPADVTDLLLSSGASAAKTAYWAFIDNLATYLNTQLLDSRGRKIPQIFRLFAECNGWYDFVAGEGYNPGTQTDRYITSIVKQAGGKYRITFAARPAGAGVPSIPLDGSVIQVTGSSDSNWNSRYDNGVVVSGNDNVGSILVADFWKGEANPAGPAPADGTLRAYPVNGFWWNGRDRAADLQQLTRDTMDYLRNTKGCTHILHATSLFPFNGVSSPWSSQETQTNASAQTFAYSNWNPGANYIDIGGIDYYPSTSSTETMNNATLTASCLSHRVQTSNKPWLIHELGFGSDNSMSGAGHQVSGFWTREFLPYLLKNYPYCAGISFWSKYMFPDVGQPAYQSFVDMVNSDSIITLDKLKRLV